MRSGSKQNVRSHKHHSGHCHVFSICHTLFGVLLLVCDVQVKNVLKQLPDADKNEELPAEVLLLSVLLWQVTMCWDKLPQCFIVDFGTSLLYHIRGHKHMFYPSALHKIFVKKKTTAKQYQIRQKLKLFRNQEHKMSTTSHWKVKNKVTLNDSPL